MPSDELDYDLDENRPNMSSANAIERLAEYLYFKLEHLDPIEAPRWSELCEDDKELYINCVKALLTRKCWIETAMERH